MWEQKLDRCVNCNWGTGAQRKVNHPELDKKINQQKPWYTSQVDTFIYDLYRIIVYLLCSFELYVYYCTILTIFTSWCSVCIGPLNTWVTKCNHRSVLDYRFISSWTDLLKCKTNIWECRDAEIRGCIIANINVRQIFILQLLYNKFIEITTVRE